MAEWNFVHRGQISWIAMRRQLLEQDGIPSFPCPCCGEVAYLVDVGMDTATGKFVPTGDVYQCDNWTCLVYFVKGDTCEQAKAEGET